MPTRLETINEGTRPAAINTKIATDWHPDAIAGVGATLVDGESIDVGSVAYESARKSLNQVYQSAADIDSAIEACTIDHRVGTEKSSGKPILRRGLDPQRLDALRAAMATSFERVAKNLEAGDRVVDGAITKLQNEVDVALRHPRANDVSVATAATEIRAFIARMPEERRTAFLHKAIVDDGDAEIAHAVLATTPYTSGLTKDQLAQVREWSADRFATRSFKQLRAAHAVKQHLARVTQRYVADYFAKLPKPRIDAATAAVAKLNG
jgi:hypothetical protein